MKIWLSIIFNFEWRDFALHLSIFLPANLPRLRSLKIEKDNPDLPKKWRFEATNLYATEKDFVVNMRCFLKEGAVYRDAFSGIGSKLKKKDNGYVYVQICKKKVGGGWANWAPVRPPRFRQWWVPNLIYVIEFTLHQMKQKIYR